MIQRPGNARRASIAALLLAFLPSAALAQVFVYPRRPNKSQVRYYDFDWRHVDIMVGPDADTSRADDFNRRPVDPPPRPPDQPGPQEIPHVPPPTESPGDVPAPAPQDPPGSPAPGAASSSAPPAAPPPGPAAPDAPFAERTLPPNGAPKALRGSATGGVRLYFYEREREVAERAAALIVDGYAYLVGQFAFVPTETFPYILYSSYQEFLQTNLFPLQEGTLGVTSPVDLKLTLPYFGDHKLFEDVSTHELAHQFTIQKVRSVSRKAGIWGEPLGAMPLWFIEGLAEYYAKRGIDPEADMLVRDIVINPDVEMGYALLGFFEDRPWSVLWTYKMGQVRCAFLEETYGRGTIQKILEHSPSLAGEVRGTPALDRFELLVRRITGDEPRLVATKFEAWLKRRAFRTYLASEQGSPQLEPVEELEREYIDALQAAPSGNLLAIRSMDLETGRSRLSLLDPREPDNRVRVAVDGVPGSESLHPVWGRNFALSDDRIAWVAEASGNDVIYWEDVSHTATQTAKSVVQQEPPRPPPPDPLGPGPLSPRTRATQPYAEPPPVEVQEEVWAVRIRLAGRRHFDIARKGLIAAYSPAFSPDGKRLAFIGFDREGDRDVYVLDPDPAAADGFRLTQLTDDVYAERHLAWGAAGLVYNSDATSHGYYNLFRVRPEAPQQVERLTTEARDHLDPHVLPDGRVLFTAFDGSSADLHEVTNGAIVRRTDINTGLFDVSPGPNGGVWALYHQSGRRRPVLVKRERFLSPEQLPQPPSAPAREIETRPLAEAVPYRPLAVRNWELGPPFGFIGAGSQGIVGQVVASAADKLRNHALLLNVAFLGSFSLTDGYLVYLNQEKRLTWGTGFFQSLIFRRDQTLPPIRSEVTIENESVLVPWTIFSGERFYGAMGSLRYPFNRFVHVQADLAVGGVDYFLHDFERELLRVCEPEATPPAGEEAGFRCPPGPPVPGVERVDLTEVWRQANPGPRLQTEATLRLGYDTIRYSARGPIAGNSFLVEGSGALQPVDGDLFGTVRLDAEQYFPIFGGMHFMLRAGAGATFGGRLARQFYLSSFDTLRGIPFGNEDWLVGRHFFFSTAELKVPLNAIIRVLILNNIEAIAGIDFGGVSANPEETNWTAWVDRRVLAPVVGVNFGLGPLVIRLHFARPIDIGVDLPVSPGEEWVTNFSIRILGFEGLFSRGGPEAPGFSAPRGAVGASSGRW